MPLGFLSPVLDKRLYLDFKLVQPLLRVPEWSLLVTLQSGRICPVARLRQKINKHLVWHNEEYSSVSDAHLLWDASKAYTVTENEPNNTSC